MEPSFYFKKWEELKSGSSRPDPEELRRLSAQVAHSFLDGYLKDHFIRQEYIDLLCDMATSFESTALNSPAADALFGIIIESLCDEFEELQVVTYNQVMTGLIEYCRRLPGGEWLDRELRNFGLSSRSMLQQRIAALRNRSGRVNKPEQVKKIFILSRVTLGADVAITSVFLQRLRTVFPDAGIVLIGPEKLQEVYNFQDGVRIRKVDYARRGGLLERLATWREVLEAIRKEADTLSADEYLVFDPDSRLSQLGVLPVCPEESYFFFNSRTGKSLTDKMTMAELANDWLCKVLGTDDFCHPKIWPAREPLVQARDMTDSLRRQGARRIITLNFGVGGNLRKRVGWAFEEKLLLALLQEPRTILFLDRGAGSQEWEASGQLLQSMATHGYQVRDTLFSRESDMDMGHGIIGIQTRFGEIAALIASSDEFIGYDSACQHIAAALEVPCSTVFAGSNNMRFIRRWSACGQNSSRIIHVDTLNISRGIDVQDIVVRVMHQRDAAGMTAGARS